MQSLFRRTIGQILVDGKFVSRRALGRALEEQKQTKELLGEVLVRLGLVKAADIKPPLLIQGHLNNIEDAVKLAAGERKLLGALLVQSGHINNSQLDEAIAEQKRTGEKLGEVLIRLGLLTDLQLKALLDLQHNQESPLANPLRIGELLVSTGYITRQQLDKALTRQAQTGQKLGEVLMAEGYVRSSDVRHGMHLQKMLLNSVVAAIMALGMNTAASASTVALEWDPSPDTAVVGYKVHYQTGQTVTASGGTPLDVQHVISTTIADLDPGSDYSFAVTAYTADGAESAFSNIITIPESVPPSTAIVSPANATTVSGIVSVQADAADNVGVTRVEFYLNGALQATSATAPYVFSWDTTGLTPGNYTLMTKAFDTAGTVGQSASRTVTVGSDLVLPSIFLTSPADLTSVQGAITISATAADNVGVVSVEFLVNGVLVYAANSTPFSYVWDTRTVSNGPNTVMAKAFDAVGNVGQSETVTVNVANDTVAPTVALTSPANNAALSGTVAITASAADNFVVSRVELYKNGMLLSTSSTPQLSYSWNTKSEPNGTYVLVLKAYDAAENVGQSETVAVTVANDVTAPTAYLTAPSSGATLTGTVSITVGALDDVGVSRVEVYKNGVLLSASNSPQLSYSWDTGTDANGTHTLMVKAYDAAGNLGQSEPVNVTIANDSIAPTVSLVSPTNNSTVSGTVTVLVEANDNVGVSKVDYYLNGALLASTNAAPYSFNWNTKSSANGIYTLSARAHDAAGNSVQSENIIVTVKNKVNLPRKK